MTPTARLLARSPLHAWHEAHGAHFVERYGWLIPAQFGDVQAEIMAVRNKICLADISAFGLHTPEWSDECSFDIRNANAGFVLIGPNCEQLLRRLTSFDVSAERLPAGASAETNLAGVHVLFVRPLNSPISQMRIYVANDVAEYVWNELRCTGRDLGIATVGLMALAQVEVMT
jgi:glycine cleavage system aminomethyltransferase T